MPVSALPTATANRPPSVPRPAPVERAESPVITALAARPQRAGDFWRTAEAQGAPLVEPDPDGDPAYAVVTFLWRGTDATRAVLAMPNKVFDPRDPAANLLTRLPGTDVWHWSLRMRTDWRATYTLCVDEGSGSGDAPAERDSAAYWQWLRGQNRRDPLNPVTLARRWGGDPLSVVELPDSPDRSAWEPRTGTYAGSAAATDAAAGAVSVHTVRSAALGNERRVWAYTPPGHDPSHEAELPVLVLFDGEMWQPGLGVSVLLDNLIADGRIPPLIALLPESLDSATRWSELACNDSFVRFLSDELLPWAAEHWPVTADPARTVLAGQSLGGLMAAHAALRAPHRFGNALSQSGSFWWPDGPDAQWLSGLVESSPKVPVRFHLSAGEQEWVLLPANRRLRDVLAAKGYEFSYGEFNGGHDYLCWRTELADGLIALLGR
ncbi:enterochelin esterase [Streptomyces sp. H27-D2]|uniref:enterochelin esterase n=1 Tax=Streptomyces sp. H27-D2 TaxID=3046304 RepID=UPI002DB61A0B|nr:enterochelin esterase [Streptomyces sp. H27-D2]MEC4016956.1 enterochelin esterase [Streptomyces sp. H27-D2]